MDEKEKQTQQVKKASKPKKQSSLGVKIILLFSIVSALFIFGLYLNISALNNISANNSEIVKAASSLENAGNMPGVSEKFQELAGHTAIRISGTIVFDVILIVVLLLIVVIACLIVFKTIAKPAKVSGQQLKQIVAGIENNQGDLTARIPVTSGDEIGQMAAGINGFIEQLQNIMRSLKQQSEKIAVSADTVKQEIIETNDNASTMSAATEQMSASMEEISATLNSIAEGSSKVLDDVKNMNERVSDGTNLVEDIRSRAQDMHQETISGKSETNKIVLDIRDALADALEESRSVEKIDELTDEILSISSQTNLLSLNASIEAARAGEAGRGFAVVADEIRVLADSSAETASNIQTISNQVTNAVKQLTGNAERMLKFIDEKVMKDYDGFVDVVEQYQKDAESVNGLLMEFAQASEAINSNVESMNTGIEDISVAVDESAKGITSVAEIAVSLANSIAQIQEVTYSNQEISEQLNDEVSRFKNV